MPTLASPSSTLASTKVIKAIPESSKTAIEFARDVSTGFQAAAGKVISPRYLYDALGSSLFEAITLLPEYGLTRADERILATYSPAIAAACGRLACVAELGSGGGKKTTHILRAALSHNPDLLYLPIDVSAAALSACEREIADLCRVRPTCSDWMEGLSFIASRRTGSEPLLLLFLGSSIGNLERAALPHFLQSVRSQLRAGDFFLLGADLEKDVEVMISAYDDPTGVTAAFNLNLLGRMNRELGAEFQIRDFQHQARWNSQDRRIEMHLVSLKRQRVHIQALDATYFFSEGESIWTESSHKFRLDELKRLGEQSGFDPLRSWVDESWPLTEVLWQVA